MLWLKAFHVVFVVTWFAGLFYLPRLFVYHAATTDAPGLKRFVVMERRLFLIMSPRGAARDPVRSGDDRRGPGLPDPGLAARQAPAGGGPGRLPRLVLPADAGVPPRRGRHTQRWYRLFNEVPALLLIAIVVLAVVKP